MAWSQVAIRVEGMTRHGPPWLLERMLRYCLPARDRETISGDLLEEYAEEQIPRIGWLRANIWYLRQVISFLSVRILGGPSMKASLTCMSLFTALIGCWLMAMEQILKHSGHTERTALAACITLQGLGTLLVLLFEGRPLSRVVISLSAVGLVLLGACSIKGILQAKHFEGFVLLIGSTLVAQGVLTLVVILRLHPTKVP